MNIEALPRGSNAIRGSANQRVAEADLGAEFDESRNLGRIRRVQTEPEPRGGAQQQRRVPQGFGGRQGEQAPSVRWQ